MFRRYERVVNNHARKGGDTVNEKEEQLLKWCREAFDNPAWKPIADNPATAVNERTTFCNQAVNFIAQKFGYTKFAGLMANQMISLMAMDHLNWVSVSMKEAQEKANAGGLAILGYAEVPHGHVAVVRPGDAVPSGKWNDVAPMIVNIGAQNSWDKTANYIFKTKPAAWCLDTEAKEASS